MSPSSPASRLVHGRPEATEFYSRVLLDWQRGRGEMADAADLKSAAARAASRFDPGRPYFVPRTQSSGAGFPANRSPIHATASLAVWKAMRMCASSGMAR